jgi:hypothetical protein
MCRNYENCYTMTFGGEDGYKEGYQNRYAMTFGGDYGFKDSTESIILSAHIESIILSVLLAESMML